MSYKGKGANLLANVPLPGLKPPPHPKEAGKENIAVQYAKLERIVISQSEEIEKLQTELLEERERNEELEQRLQEMNDFLADYGLHWVGGPAPKDATFENGPEDMNRFMARIAELNEHCISKKPQLKQEKNIVRLQHEKPMTITLFNDYFTLDNGEQRYYNTPLNAQFFRDIMDGFYPSEFKDDYPNGLQFKVVDNRAPEMYQGNARHINENIEDRAKNASRDGRVKAVDENVFGEGDGVLRMRIPPLGTKTLKTSENMKMREIRRFVESTFSIHEFEICDSVTGKQYDDDATLKSLNLYPKGIVSVMTPRK